MRLNRFIILLVSLVFGKFLEAHSNTALSVCIIIASHVIMKGIMFWDVVKHNTLIEFIYF